MPTSPHRPAAELLAQPDVRRLRVWQLLDEIVLIGPSRLLAAQLDRLLVERLVAQAVGDHQLRFAALRGGDHLLALVDVTAIGFSHSTCLPALSARIVYSACMLLGRMM